MITHIFHVSDIHIFEKNYTNIRSSWATLVADIVAWPNYRMAVVLVITGDIFEFKTYLNSDDVHLFYEMMAQLESHSIRTVIIPGNHDYNINSKCAQDNISILLGAPYSGGIGGSLFGSSMQLPKWEYINCYSKTGIYRLDNLSFYVYSPIDKLTPTYNADVTDTVRIALLHEPIISAQFDNNENIYNGRFKQEDLAHYDITMLGDIHRPQFLAPNMAYAGSFVQKNRGEGLNHGYILWDVAKRSGRHIWIPLKEIALKIVGKDNKYVAPLPDTQATITYLALIHQNCSAEWVQTAAEEIRDKYKRPISQIIRHDPVSNAKMKLDISNTLQIDMSKLSHATLITEMLKTTGTSQDMIQQVLDYHNKFLQNRQLYPTVRYYIRYLVWSNVFCYGPNNHINFEELNGLAALSGKNKIGKSSVIDILIRILFNECERGHKDDIINKHAKSAYIKCCFRIVNDEYIIEQSWQKYSAATTFHLYKNGHDITKDTIVKTYKYMREDLGLGNYKDFVNLTTAMQNRQFIIDLDKKDMHGLLCKLLDIDTMRDIEEYIKKEREFLRRDKKAKLKELDALGAENGNDEAWTKEIVQLEERSREEAAAIIDIESQIREVQHTVRELYRKIQDVDIAPDWTPDLDTIPNVTKELPFSQQEYCTKEAALDELKVKFGIYKERLNTYDKARIKSIKDTDYADLFAYFGANNEHEIISQADKIAALKDGASNRLWIIEPLKNNLTLDELRAVQEPTVLNAKLDELYAALVPCDQSNVIQIEHPTIADYSYLREQQRQCQDAQKNITIYKARRSVAAEILREYKAVYNGDETDHVFDAIHVIFEKYNDQYAVAKSALKINLQDIDRDIASWDAYNTIIANNKVIEKNNCILERIATYKRQIDIRNDIQQHERILENSSTEHLRDLYAKYKEVKYLCEYNEIRQQMIDLRNEVESIKLQLVEYKEIDVYNQAIKDRDANLAKYKQLLNNKQFESEIEELVVHEISLSKHKELAANNLAEFRRSVSEIRALTTRYTEVKDKINELDKVIMLYDLYYSCINHKTGIPSRILHQACVVLSERCNQILSQITDFTVEFVFDEDIKIYTITKGVNDMSIRLSASLGSGFQKFLLDMILRIVLTRISNISNPNILFVDEGFGCLDKENFSNVCACLTKLKDNFDAMIVITHIPELQSYMDQMMAVSVDDGFSQLRFGQLPMEYTELFEMANLRIIKQTLDNAGATVLLSANDRNPEVIMIDNHEEIKVDQSQIVEQSIWDQHLDELANHFNLQKEEIPSAIFAKIFGGESADVNGCFVCGKCQKQFKKKDTARAHLESKSYKSKHIKYMLTKRTELV
jgi:DNA repair exonuclease SbcCD ATPase subunit